MIKKRTEVVNTMIHMILENLEKQITSSTVLKGHSSTNKSSFTVLKNDWAPGEKKAKLIGLFNFQIFPYSY